MISSTGLLCPTDRSICSAAHEHFFLICNSPTHDYQNRELNACRRSPNGPALVWYLSGLTCTWANVMEKSGLQRYAAEHGLVVVAPDTSPRGDEVPDDEAYDLGQGAGFYLTATESPWNTHFQMDTYLTEELGPLITSQFPVDSERQGITGHSMGGHGALTLHLKHPDRYRSVSAFSPIVAPSQVPWGRKALLIKHSNTVCRTATIIHTGLLQAS